MKAKNHSQLSTLNSPLKNRGLGAVPKGILYILSVLQRLKIEYQTEYKFSQERKFRFDIAIPKDKIAIEYEGIFSLKSRHTSLKGYSMDTEKYNLAQIEGWKVLRYTAINYLQIEKNLSQLKIKTPKGGFET